MPKSLEALHRDAERHLDDASIWLQLGVALAERARERPDPIDRAAAIAALRHAASIAKLGELVGAIAAALADLGEIDAACAELQALPGPGESAGAPSYQNVVRRLLDEGRGPDALALLARAGTLVEADDELRLLRAHARAEAGEVAGALADIDRVLAGHPEHLGAHLVRARLLAAEERTAECIAEWETAVRLSPDDPQAMTGLGVALASAGRHEEAIEILFQVTQANASSSDTYLNLAIVLREAGRLDEAEWAARRALELAPDAVQPHYDLGLVLEAAGKLPEAAQALREAAQRDAGWVRPTLALARVLEHDGRVDEAIETLARAAAQLPRDAEEQKQLFEALATLRLRAPAASGAFAGSLSAFSLWQVLEIIQNHRSSGRLELSLQGARADLFVREGALLRIVSEQAPRLVDVILSLQGADRSRIAPALAGQRGATDAAVARTLLRLGVIDNAALLKAVEHQLVATLERLIDRRDGSFAFHQEAVTPNQGDVEVDIRFALLEIARTRDGTGVA
jgi:tetratricopeptide (TPR) repeat protein